MGYDMWQRDVSFFIAVNDIPLVEQALNAFENVEKSLEDHFFDYDFEVYFDSDGNVEDVVFVGEKITGQYEFLAAMVPYVQEGSYLEFVGEDYAMWRWVYRNGKLDEIQPEIKWENDE